MADKDTLTPEQSKAAQAIAAVMAKLSVDAEKVAESFRGQAKAMAELCEAMKCLESSQSGQNAGQLSTALRDMGAAAGPTSAALIELGRNTQNLGGGFENLGGQIAKASQQNRDFNKEGKNSSNIQKDFAKKLEDSKKKSSLLATALGALVGAFNALKAAVEATMAVSKAAFGIFTQLIESAFNVGMAIISIPFKVISSLIDMADKGGNEISELAQAINEMRKQFGSLTGPTNKAIKSTAEGMNNLRIAGTSTFQVFGNVAERMKMLTELYAAAGPNLRSFAGEITKSNGAQIALQKGLGLTAEGMESLASISKSSGIPLSDTLVNITKHADHMAKAFKLDAKVISREITKAASDFKNFGNVSIKEMGIAVTYAQKLGLSLDKITGTMESFGTFDSAADNVSKLNEAFGTNIDAMEIMQAETPEKKLEILRRSMRQAGIQGENLNHIQRKLIASATGLDDQAIISAMSTKNYGVSLKDVQKEGGKAEKKTLTQAQAMEKLADAMDRMLKASQPLTGGEGLFGALFNGFERGLQLHPAFKEMMIAMKRTIMTIYLAGQRLGNMFVEYFPGVKKLFESLTSLFDPAKFSALTDKIVNIFKDFFKDIGDPNSKNSFGKLMTKLKDTFFDFFNANKEEGKGVIDSFKEIFKAIARTIGQAIPWLMIELAGIIKWIAGIIKDPDAAMQQAGAAVDGSGFGAIFAEAFKEIKDVAWPVLAAALGDLFDAAFGSLKGWWDTKGAAMFENIAKEIAPYIALILFGPAFAQAIFGAFVGSMSSALTGGGVKKALEKQATSLGDLAKKLAPQAGGAPGGVTPTPPVPNVTPQQTQALNAMEQSKLDWGKIKNFLIGFAWVMAIGLVAFLAAVLIVKATRATTEDVLKAVGAMIGIGVVAMMVAPVFQKISESKEINKEQIYKFLGTLAGVMVVGVLALAGMIYLAQKTKVDAGTIAKVIALSVAMGVLVSIATGLAYLAIKVSEASNALDAKMLAKGLAIIGVVILAMVASAALLIGVVKLFNASGDQMKGMAALLDSIAVAFVMTLPIIMIAAGVGYAIAGSAGTLLPALASGFPIMLAAVAAMAGVAGGILASLNEMKGDPVALKMKAEAFVAIMNAVTDLASKVGSILEIVADMTSFWDTPEENQATINSMTELIKAVLGKGGKEGGGIQGVIAVLMEGMKDIKPDKVGVMQAFGGIISGVGTMIQAVGQSLSEFQDSTESIWEKLVGQDPKKMETNIKSGESYMASTLTAIGSLITNVVGAFKNVSASDAAAAKEIGGPIGSILQAFTGLMKAVIPDPKTFSDEMETAAEGSYLWGMVSAKGSGKTKNVNKKAMDAMTEHIQTMMTSMTTLLPTMINAMASSLVQNANQLDPEKIKVLEVIGKVIDSVAKLANSFTSNMQATPPDPSKIAAGTTVVTKITQIAPDVGKSLDAVTQKLPGLIGTIMTVAAGVGEMIKDEAKFEKNIDAVIKIMGVVEKIGGMMKSLDGIDFSQGSKQAGSHMAEGLDAANWALAFLERGWEGSESSGSGAPLRYFIDHITSPIWTEAAGLSTKIEPISKTFEAIGKLMAAIKGSAGGIDVTADNKDIGSKLAESVDVLNWTFMFLEQGWKGSLSSGEGAPIPALIKHLNNPIWAEAQGLDSQIGKFTEFFQKINKLMKDVSASAANMGEGSTKEGAQKVADGISNLVTIASSIEKLANSVKVATATQMVPAIKAVEEMIDAAVRLDKALTSGAKIDIDTKLKVFASKFGKQLGSMGNYVVSAKDVNIHINFKVAIDSQELERIMVSNGSSVIKQRINLLLDAVKDDTKSSQVKTDIGYARLATGATPVNLTNYNQ